MASVFDRPRPDPEQGVFETMLVIDGRPVELDAHLARLAASVEALHPDRAPIDPREAIEHRAAGIELGSIRVAVAPVDPRGLSTEIATKELDPQLARGALLPVSGSNAPTRAIALRSLELVGGLGAHKWADRSLLDEAQSRLPEDALPLLVDQGAVLEASRANVFAVRDGDLLTPPTDGRILPGVTRARVREIAASASLRTREITLRHDDLLAADEVFLTGSVRGVERVVALDGTALPAGGEISSRISAELWRAWAE